LLQFKHLDRLTAAVVDDEDLHGAAPVTFQQRDSMGSKRIADGSGTRGISPILARLCSNRQFAESLLRGIEQHEPRNSGARRTTHKLTDDDVFAVGRQLQIFGRARSANDFDVAMRTAFHQWRLRWGAFPLREGN